MLREWMETLGRPGGCVPWMIQESRVTHVKSEIKDLKTVYSIHKAKVYAIYICFLVFCYGLFVCAYISTESILVGSDFAQGNPTSEIPIEFLAELLLKSRDLGGSFKEKSEGWWEFPSIIHE